MKNLTIGLLPRLIIGIIAGILVGLFLPEWIGRLLYTFTHLFGQFLVFMVPLIIVGFIAAGIAELGAKAGKLLAGTAGLAYGSTVLAGVLAYFVSTGIIPRFIEHGDVGESTSGLAPFLEISTPPIFGVMTALVTAFVFGLGINYLKQKENRTALFNWMDEFRSIIVLVITKVIIPFLPLHIAGIFADMAASGEAFQTLAVFARVFLVIIGTHLLWIITQYTIAALRTGVNPFKAIRQMLPAYTTALGTMSSAATIPVTLASVKSNGVSDRTAEFVVPLSATIHLAGSTITLVACSVAVLILNGITPEFGMFFQFILLLGVTMIAAPGVPGGAVVAAIGLMASVLGMTDAQLGLMFALYMAQDGFGTACNVTGDGAIALIVDSMDSGPEA
ncbi:MAG: dicarboxylate/amino acid:cation symporter [Candidatus Cyclonatronum sp.]|uniref:dicarboxylate/amino acid:cation symporter n=1 Tax=Cyclonatronum sp. TaxID=3024185 RepID=UPI0025C2360B|nr:dicarboxylate/amino acid:cation symporter [Cyclonatronum sp.]MCC5934406.1 dicarboxylate/amino acid:cation symporter [Balneolales bacterium]MCH8486981.1 dicarboxylate/amino acid:cation symporter [Cyclonatronum sp.]